MHTPRSSASDRQTSFIDFKCRPSDFIDRFRQRTQQSRESKPRSQQRESKSDSTEDLTVCVSYWQYLHSCWKYFCSSSALHGVRYFVGKGRPTWERYFWMASVTICVGLSFMRLGQRYLFWSESPAVLSVALRSTPTWEVPFPAVSICLVNQIYYFPRCKFEGHIGHRKLVCNDSQRTTEEGFGKQEHNKSLFPSIHDVVKECIWNGVRLPNCANGSVFQRILSNQGTCFTFNMLSLDEIFTDRVARHQEGPRGLRSGGWTLQNGYPRNSSIDTFPRRALGSGVDSGLVLMLNMSLDKQLHKQWKIVLHSPVELPIVEEEQSEGNSFIDKRRRNMKVDEYTKIFYRQPQRNTSNFFVPVPNHTFMVSIAPDVVDASASLRDISPASRHCYFPKERSLVYFKVYTQINCEIECATVYMIKHHKCVPPYVLALFDCGCLPSCVRAIRYDLHIEKVRSMSEEEHAVYMEMEDLERAGWSRVAIHLKDSTFTTCIKSNLYNWPEYIADCAGSLVLCSGFSMITVIEILYFMTIRWWCSVLISTHCPGKSFKSDKVKINTLTPRDAGSAFDQDKRTPQRTPSETETDPTKNGPTVRAVRAERGGTPPPCTPPPTSSAPAHTSH